MWFIKFDIICVEKLEFFIVTVFIFYLKVRFVDCDDSLSKDFQLVN